MPLRHHAHIQLSGVTHQNLQPAMSSGTSASELDQFPRLDSMDILQSNHGIALKQEKSPSVNNSSMYT